MSTLHDGPASPHFAPLPFRGNANLAALAGAGAAAMPPGMTGELAAALEHAPGGSCVCWSRIAMSSHGGTVDVVWQVASVTVPMSRVELVVNGEIRESVAVAPDAAAGGWSVRVDKSSWLALLVRGHYPDQPEIIAAHSTPVMIDVEGFPLMAAADAVTILDQIEGATVYLDTVGTRADDRSYKRMRLTLESARRALHNRLHQRGYYHEHTLGKESGP
jgi:hypothetical protein